MRPTDDNRADAGEAHWWQDLAGHGIPMDKARNWGQASYFRIVEKSIETKLKGRKAVGVKGLSGLTLPVGGWYL